MGLSLEPPMVTLTSEAGSRPTADFELMGQYEDGSMRRYRGPIRFEIEDRSLGRVDEASGAFTASGVAGGSTQITAAAIDRPGLEVASATVQIELEYQLEGPGLPDDYAQLFEAPTTDPAQGPGVVYPLDGALLPQNAFPVDIQWTRGEPGDLFEIAITKPGLRITTYLAHQGDGFGNHWLIDPSAWRAITQTSIGQPTSIQVTRHVAATGVTVREESPRQIDFAEASLDGSIYYWEVSSGSIKRIDDGTGRGQSFMPSPPAGRDGNNCVGCHSVSHDGRYMVGRLGGGDNVGAVFDLTKDLTQAPAPAEFEVTDDGPNWWFSTWKPDDSLLMVSRRVPGVGDGLALLDPYTGQLLEPESGPLPEAQVTHPAWAPDDSLIAYISGANDWGSTNTSGDLATMQVQGPRSFGPPEVLKTAAEVAAVPGAHPPSGTTISYPTWSPDAQWIAFAHGTGSRSDRHQAALYLMRRDGGQVTRLDAANAGPQTDFNFQPNFSPFDDGGYYWLTFLSRRPYGNAEVGNLGAEPAHPQVWITAIKKDPAPGEDPSAAAYWLTGQDPRSSSLSGYWAPRACRDDGDGCEVGSQCCSGECVPGADGQLTCSPPPPDRCRERLEACSEDAECCDEDALCLNGVCWTQQG